MQIKNIAIAVLQNILVCQIGGKIHSNNDYAKEEKQVWVNQKQNRDCKQNRNAGGNVLVLVFGFLEMRLENFLVI